MHEQCIIKHPGLRKGLALISLVMSLYQLSENENLWFECSKTAQQISSGRSRLLIEKTLATLLKLMHAVDLIARALQMFQVMRPLQFTGKLSVLQVRELYLSTQLFDGN